MSDLDFNDDFDADEMAAYADDARKARREDGPAPEDLPPVRLDPILWMPPVLQAKPSLREIDPAYDAYRIADRVFRRAFGGSGRGRRAQLRAAHALAHMVANQEES